MLGVKIISIGLIIFGFLEIISGFSMLYFKEDVFPIFSESLKEYVADEEIISLTYDVSSYLTVFLGIIYLSAGIGLFLLKTWARFLALAIFTFNAAYFAIASFINPAAIVGVVLSVLVVWYLMKENVRESFREKSIEEKILGG